MPEIYSNQDANKHGVVKAAIGLAAVGGIGYGGYRGVKALAGKMAKDMLKDTVSTAGKETAQASAQVASDVASGAVKEAVKETTTEAVNNAHGSVLEGIKNTVGGAVDATKNFVNNVSDNVIPALNQKVKGFINHNTSNEVRGKINPYQEWLRKKGYQSNGTGGMSSEDIIKRAKGEPLGKAASTVEDIEDYQSFVMML